MNFLDGAAQGTTVALADEAATVTLAGRARAALGNAPGRRVRLGIRPEHVALDGAQPAGAACSLPGSVEVVESLGHATLVYVRLQSERRLNVLLNGKVALRAGDAVRASFAPEHIYLFDAESEQALQGVAG